MEDLDDNLCRSSSVVRFILKLTRGKIACVVQIGLWPLFTKIPRIPKYLKIACRLEIFLKSNSVNIKLFLNDFCRRIQKTVLFRSSKKKETSKKEKIQIMAAMSGRISSSFLLQYAKKGKIQCRLCSTLKLSTSKTYSTQNAMDHVKKTNTYQNPGIFANTVQSQQRAPR